MCSKAQVNGWSVMNLNKEFPTDFEQVKEQEEAMVVRWLETKDGDVISVVKREITTKKKSYIDSEYYEIRVTIGEKNVAIPASISIINNWDNARLLKCVKMHFEREKKWGS